MGNAFPECPEGSCNAKITTSTQVLQEVLSRETFEIYNELMTRSLVLGTHGKQVIYRCPRPQCNAENSRLEDETTDHSQSLACGFCPYVFCTKCRQSAHGGKCKFAFEHCSQILQELKSGCEVDVNRQLSMFKMADVVQMVEEVREKNGEGFEKAQKPCGNCKRMVEKPDQYNKVLCNYCNRYFCWLCGKSLRKEKDPNLHYDPNKYPKSSCANKLINYNEIKQNSQLSEKIEALFSQQDYSHELE